MHKIYLCQRQIRFEILNRRKNERLTFPLKYGSCKIYNIKCRVFQRNAHTSRMI